MKNVKASRKVELYVVPHIYKIPFLILQHKKKLIGMMTIGSILHYYGYLKCNTNHIWYRILCLLGLQRDNGE